MRRTLISVTPVLRHARWLTVLAVIAMMISPMAASATSYVMMADEDLVDLAEVVVHGRIIDVRVVRVGGAPYTEHVVEVIDPIRGTVGRTVVFRQLGGVLPEGEGMSLKIFGLPQYAPGDGVVLFLSRWQDDTYRAADMLLGGFRTVNVHGRTFAVRQLDGRDEVDLEGAGPQRRESLRRAHHPRDLGLWLDWLRDRVDGIERAPDYFVEPDVVPNSVREAFTLFVYNDLNIRWTNFDSGPAVNWGVHKKNRQKGLPSKGVSQVNTAIKAWNKIGNIAYGFLGKVNAPAGFYASDGKNTVAYNDPQGEIPGSYNCGVGGVLAIGGMSFTLATHNKKGKTYLTTVEADIVFQDGLTCFFRSAVREGGRAARGSSSAAEQINAHELGHTLGIAHSTKNALMEPVFKNDGSGAVIRKDDKRAAISKKGMRYKR